MAERKQGDIYGQHDTPEPGEKSHDIHEERVRRLRFAGAVLDVIKNFGGNQPTFLIALARNLGMQDASTIKQEIALSQEEIIRCAEDIEEAAHNNETLYTKPEKKTLGRNAGSIGRIKTMYEFSGEEIGAINVCLQSMSQFNTYSGRNSDSKGINRYQKLLQRIDNQVGDQRNGEEIEGDDIYCLNLSWHKKRTLRGALRFAQLHQKLLVYHGMRHISEDFIRSRHRLPAKVAIHKEELSEVEKLRQKEKERLARLALTADGILTRLGYSYLKPADNIKIFKLENLILLGLK